MNYEKSRDLAWQLLMKHKISVLPVNLTKICKAERIRLCSYENGSNVIQKLQLEEHTVGNDAFSIGRVIFYNDENSIARQRFSIAHEMGHIFLHSPCGATVYNREPSTNEDPLEAEANIFASRLLAPLCVLHYLNVHSPEEISRICNISITAARIRMERLNEVRKREETFRRVYGRSCFLQSPYEREVFRMFSTFIETHRNS